MALLGKVERVAGAVDLDAVVGRVFHLPLAVGQALDIGNVAYNIGGLVQRVGGFRR